MVARSIHNSIKETKLELLDRVLGALLGIAKMSAILCCVCAAIAALAIPMTQAWMEQSTLAPHFARGTEMMVVLIPQSCRERWDANVQEARDQLEKKAADAALDAIRGDAARK
jgi:uncharacterized membrane protein required for colicin V production